MTRSNASWPSADATIRSRTRAGEVTWLDHHPQNEQKALQPVDHRGGWFSLIRESFAGAWQRNIDIRVENVLTYTAVFSCISLIANDIAKLRLRLVRQDDDGIWVETESSAFSPVLRRPNRYQNRIQFIAQWVTSKLVHGNTYVLKQRDQRGIVTALYILHPLRVTVARGPGRQRLLRAFARSSVRPPGR